MQHAKGFYKLRSANQVVDGEYSPGKKAKARSTESSYEVLCQNGDAFL
jgi:hypothetical protein